MDSNISPNQYSERESWQTMLNRFYADVTHLMEKEGQLIRAELGEKATEVKTATSSLIGGGIVFFVGIISLAATVTILLSNFITLWLASLIVTVSFLLVGGGMLGTAKKKLEADKLRPTRSMEAFSEFRHTLKEKVNEITKH